MTRQEFDEAVRGLVQKGLLQAVEIRGQQFLLPTPRGLETVMALEQMQQGQERRQQ